MKMKLLLLFSLPLLLCACHSLYKGAAPHRERLRGIPLSVVFHYEKGKAPEISIHRGGGTYPGYPENCLESIRHVARHGVRYFEIDIRKTADGKLVLLHDRSLDRTTTGKGLLSKKTYAELRKLCLKDWNGKVTFYKIPLFSKVLRWEKTRSIILMLDRKDPLSWDTLLSVVKSRGAVGQCVVITYSAEEARSVYRAHPESFLVGMHNEREFHWMIESGIPTDKTVAFTGTKRSPRSLYGQIHHRGIRAQLSTLGNLGKRAVARRDDAVYRRYVREGIDILATDRPIEVARALGLAE